MALDIRMTLKKEAAGLIDQLKELCTVLANKAMEYSEAIMPAIPICSGHNLSPSVIICWPMGRCSSGISDGWRMLSSAWT